MTTELMCGDCLDLMWRVPSQSVDAIICDLPYGTTACSWDVVIPFEPLWSHYKRVAKKNAAIVLFGQQPFTSLLIVSNLEMFRYCWEAEKSRPTGFLDAVKKPLRAHEDIAVFYRSQPVFNPQMWEGKPNHNTRKSLRKRQQLYSGPIGELAPNTSSLKYPRSVIRVRSDNNNNKIHPTQKSLALMEYLIKTYTNEGDTILDNCMGSGSTGVACKNTNRNFIGIEKDPDYFEIARKRIEGEKAEPYQVERSDTQPTLFAG